MRLLAEAGTAAMAGTSEEAETRDVHRPPHACTATVCMCNSPFLAHKPSAALQFPEWPDTVLQFEIKKHPNYLEPW